MGFKDLAAANEIVHLELNPPNFHDWLLIKRKWLYLDPTALQERERELWQGADSDRGAAGW